MEPPGLPRHPPRPGMRPGFFPYPRRGMHHHMRPGFFPPRPFMHGQNFMGQWRGMRHGGGPGRGGRCPPPPPGMFPPHPGSDGSGHFHPFPPPPPPVWGAQQAPVSNVQPQTEQQADPDTTSDYLRKKKKKLSAGAASSGGGPLTPGGGKPWDRQAAERAHALELECQQNANAKSIVIRFPDPELSKDIVQAFHSSIDNVHFQGPCGGRYCFVTLKDEANVEKVMEEINKIKFGVGFLTAERKVQKPEENASHLDIDPYVLYVGNLALNITVAEVKEKFPSASRIDVGHAKKMKNTRYAFVKFSTAEAALEAYKDSVNTIMASRSIIVRFRRTRGTTSPQKEKTAPTPEPKPAEKLTVGAKLKAKREKAAREAAAAGSVSSISKSANKNDVDSDEEVELENDDESLSEYDMDDLDLDIEDEDDDQMEDLNKNSDSEEEYELSWEEYDDTDDDSEEGVPAGSTKEEDLEYNDEDDDDTDCKDIFSL